MTVAIFKMKASLFHTVVMVLTVWLKLMYNSYYHFLVECSF